MGAPKAGSDRIYRCSTCRRADVRALWRCSACERELCEHGMKVLRLNGAGYCRSCQWKRAVARARANEEAAQRSPLGGLTVSFLRDPSEMAD